MRHFALVSFFVFLKTMLPAQEILLTEMGKPSQPSKDSPSQQVNNLLFTRLSKNLTVKN